MSDRRTLPRPRRTAAPKRRPDRPTRSVEEMLLEATYRMHATRVVKVLPAPESATARN